MSTHSNEEVEKPETAYQLKVALLYPRVSSSQFTSTKSHLHLHGRTPNEPGAILNNHLNEEGAKTTIGVLGVGVCVAS